MAKLIAETYTDSELLALCKQAIAEITVFQTSTFRGKTVTRANLSDLIKLRDDLEDRIERDAGRRMVHVQATHGRR